MKPYYKQLNAKCASHLKVRKYQSLFEKKYRQHFQSGEGRTWETLLHANNENTGENFKINFFGTLEMNQNPVTL